MGSGTQAGTLKYLATTDTLNENNLPGLYLFDGSKWVKVLVQGDVSPIIPITFKASSPITFTWDEATHTITIGHA